MLGILCTSCADEFILAPKKGRRHGRRASSAAASLDHYRTPYSISRTIRAAKKSLSSRLSFAKYGTNVQRLLYLHSKQPISTLEAAYIGTCNMHMCMCMCMHIYVPYKIQGQV